MLFDRAASKALYFSVGPGAPTTVLTQETLVYSFTYSQATGGPIQVTLRNAAQTIIYAVIRLTVNQTQVIFNWPTLVDGLHITMDVGAAAADFHLEVGHS